MQTAEHEVPVLVVGGGPVGLLTAWQLAFHGIKCMLAERNVTTTQWPKMDITNCRSMELLKSLGLADKLREHGVSQDKSFDVIFSSGLGDGGERIAKWDLPGPDEWRSRIRDKNDGSMPREPYQRCSQAVFEAWLKPLLDEHPLVDTFFGLKFESLTEKEDGVTSELVDVAGRKHFVYSKYVIGCDGGGSRVRRNVEINLSGGPVPGKMHLVHFKSRDLDRLHRQGQFWHIFFTNGSCIISQDELDTWTVHLALPLEVETNQLDPYEVICRVLGGTSGPLEIQVDEILLHNTWRPNLAVADSYRTPKGRVFLAGDSAHQNIPTGGYGMNTGVADAFDIGWKLAAVLNGYGGEHLLASYEVERRPVALRNVERSGVHASVHRQYSEWVAQKGLNCLLKDTSEARELKKKIADFVQEHDGENKDHGIEMGYIFPNSPVIISDGDPETFETTNVWPARNYTPSTIPGRRAPHVWLQDGQTSIVDLYGKGFTVVDFTASGEISRCFEEVASRLQVPLMRVHLPDECNVRDIWQCAAAILRPDGFVAWRHSSFKSEPLSDEEVEDILQVVVGQRSAK
ncbi:FAD binding domain-containing protein [Aspergillus bertholletiae]|uniref:FAD binding domain-containing protein n=1 Tax=Aspergillus bertholletiae TaxID=1226010 RepID=A0A5N7B8U7_9EURO|nr:FAD binding domain-containing protein [Aspergillus bertholletiae]